MKTFYRLGISLLLISGFYINGYAQKADIKNSTIPKSDLPKLEKVMVFGDDKGVTKAPDQESFGMHISDSEALNRSQSDGKISRKEDLIIERAKRMPQDR
jgi:hypothetical protein